MLHHLVDHGADTNHQDGEGCPLLHHACMMGRVAIVKLLIKHKARTRNRDAAGCTALHVSCRHVAEGLSQNPGALLEAGVGAPLEARYAEAFAEIDKNKTSDLSRSELIQACRANARVREMLGLPARLQPEHGTLDAFENVFHSSAGVDGSHSISLAEFTKLAHADVGRRRLVEECRSLLVEAMLAEDPEQIDFQDHAGDSAMHIAARLGADALVELLHSAGADPELWNKQRDTPNTLMQLHSEAREVRAADQEARADRRREESIVAYWTAGDVVAWLGSLQLGVSNALYARAFAEAGVDGQDLLSVTEADLGPQHEGGLGVDLWVHRRKILRELDAMCAEDDRAVRVLDRALSKAVEQHCSADQSEWTFGVIQAWGARHQTRSQGPALAVCG